MFESLCPKQQLQPFKRGRQEGCSDNGYMNVNSSFSMSLTHLEAVFSTCTGRQGRRRFPPSAFHAQTAPGAPRAYPGTQVRWQGLCPSRREQSQRFVSGGRRSLLTGVAGAAGGETMAWLSRDLALPAQSRPWMVCHGNKCSCLLSDPCGLAPQCLRITSPTSPPSWPQGQGTVPRSGLAGGPGYASAERTWSEGSFQRPCSAWPESLAGRPLLSH